MVDQSERVARLLVRALQYATPVAQAAWPNEGYRGGRRPGLDPRSWRQRLPNRCRSGFGQELVAAPFKQAGHAYRRI